MKKFKYQVGDIVRVVCEQEIAKKRVFSMENDSSIFSNFNSGMRVFENKVVTISEIVRGRYRIEEGGYYWTDEMFNEVNYKKPKNTPSFERATSRTPNFESGLRRIFTLGGSYIVGDSITNWLSNTNILTIENPREEIR